MDFLAVLTAGADHPQKREINFLAPDGNGDIGARLRAFMETFGESAPAPELSDAVEAGSGETRLARAGTELLETVATLAAGKVDFLRDDAETATALVEAPQLTEEIIQNLTVVEEIEVEELKTVDGAAVAQEAVVDAPALAAAPPEGAPAQNDESLRETAARLDSDDIVADDRDPEPDAADRKFAEINPNGPATGRPDALRVQAGAPALKANLAATLDNPKTLQDDPDEARAVSTERDAHAERFARAPATAPASPDALSALRTDAAGPPKGGDMAATPVAVGERAGPADIALQHAAVKSDAAQSANLHQPTPPIDAARQVIAAIRSGPGGDAIEVRLDPPDLGRVRIHFRMETPHAVTATVTADRGETLDLLRRHGDDLARELQRSGFENVQLDFSAGRNRNPAFDALAQTELSDVAAIDAAGDQRIVYLSMRDNNHLDRLV